MTRTVRWIPVAVLGVGCLLSLGTTAQKEPHLRAPLATALPDSIQGVAGENVSVSGDEATVAGFTDYAFRVYQSPDTTSPLPSSSIYLGYYDRQTRGRTIHSPKNCLPGAGWDALSSGPERVAVGSDTITVNRYVLQNGDARALVLYWYQGRGRVAYNEYRVKWNLLRDAIVKRRTDEALVRIVVGIKDSEQASLALAKRIAARLEPAVFRALPL